MSDNFTCVAASTGTTVTNQTITKRPFVAEEHGICDPKDPFAKAVIDKQLADRLARKTFPNQRQTSLCGPAAFFYCLQIKHPAFYRMVVEGLWRTGEAQIARLHITPHEKTKRPKFFFNGDNPRILGIDWMTLAGLRSSSNWAGSYNSPDETLFKDIRGTARSLSNMFLAITSDQQMTSWLTQAGFEKVDDTKFLTVSNLLQLNKHYREGCLIVALINGAMLDGQSSVKRPLPSHWVVWSGTLNDRNGKPITSAIKDADGVQLTVFSWGKDKYPIKASFSLADFRRHSFQFLVFK